jgi:hypothetical protein
MQQPPQRLIPSVSDLYGTDEIEFLLDEIRDLEPACCQIDDIQVIILISHSPPRARHST